MLATINMSKQVTIGHPINMRGPAYPKVRRAAGDAVLALDPVALDRRGWWGLVRATVDESVDQLYVIADNHDDLGAHSGGSYTITGRRTC
jgi:hypothetical protein